MPRTAPDDTSISWLSARSRWSRHAALVATRKEGLTVYDRLVDPAVHEFLRSLQDVADEHAAGHLPGENEQETE